MLIRLKSPSERRAILAAKRYLRIVESCGRAGALACLYRQQYHRALATLCLEERDQAAGMISEYVEQEEGVAQLVWEFRNPRAT